MGVRIDKSWTVLRSVEDSTHDRCVDFFVRMDGSYGFEEFRRDVEDQGVWTPTSHYSGRAFQTQEDAVKSAAKTIPWLGEALPG